MPRHGQRAVTASSPSANTCLLAQLGALLCLLLPRPAALAHVASAERAALVDLYLSTNTPGWANSSGWADYRDANNDPCEQLWFGIACSPGASRVVYATIASSKQYT